MSTSCVHTLPVDRAFAIAKQAGFDGVEVMVTHDPATRNIKSLRELSARYDLPILSIHAPVLLLTQFVWGTDPHVKLARSAELAVGVGASTVVVHPPFRWQRRTARGFTESVRTLSREWGIDIAVENMFAPRILGRRVAAYSPGWSPVDMDCDAATLDFSHASLAGDDALVMAERLGSRLRHVHLCDGSGAPGAVFDEHLVPGEGSQPVAETLRLLAATRWSGSVVAEVHASGPSAADRLDILHRTLAFAREHTRLEAPAPAPGR